MRRRDVVLGGLAAGGAASGLALTGSAKAQPREAASVPKPQPMGAGSFWPDGIRLPISISLMFESGAQPRFGAPTPLVRWTPPEGIYDMPTITWYRYGVTEGIPRALDMFEKLNIRVTSHMSGQAVQMYPETARSIVQAGHEAAAHGWDWSTESTMTAEEERAFIKMNVDVIEKATGQRPVGFNAPGLRGSRNVLQVLHSLGFKYHIDDVSRDEPFVVNIDRQSEIAVVPYTMYLNDIFAYEGRSLSDDQFYGLMKRSFDQLYEESVSRRRMMAISMHDRMVRPEHARTMREFIFYMQQKQGVVFMKKVDIADFILRSPSAIREPIGVVYPIIPGLYNG